MLLPESLVPGRVRRRLNRFLVEVEVDGTPVLAHLANSGRVLELLTPGAPALLALCAGGRRRTAYDLVLVRAGCGWVCADARLPNRLVREALEAGLVEPLRAYPEIQTEQLFGESRIDFLLAGPRGECLLETKSATLVEDGVALFPDAPTLRGVRHLRELIAARRCGLAAAVFFVVQREDASALRPHDSADPLFGRALREAAAAGVLTLASRCRVTPREVLLADPIPVLLE